MTEATERQQRLAELIATGRVTDDSRVRLFPVLTQSSNGQFTVLRRDTGQMISTSEEGVEALRLMLRGRTLQATRKGLADKYGCDADGVDLSTLLDCLAQVDFLKSIDGNRISTTRVAILDRFRTWFQTHVSSAGLLFVVQHCPLWIALPILDRKRRRRPEVIAQIADNHENLRRAEIDKVLLVIFGARTLDRWIRKYSRPSGVLILCDTRTTDQGELPRAPFLGQSLRMPRGVRWPRQRTQAGRG